MYKKHKQINERDKLLYMAGLSLTHLLGYKTARQYCMNAVLMVGDVDTDEVLLFSNSIDSDVLNVAEDHTSAFSAYFDAVVGGYVRDDERERVRGFFDRGRLRAMFEQGCMSESTEYPCDISGATKWMRACYELEQSEDDHVIATVVLFDITAFRTSQES